MPKMNGIQLLGRVKETQPETSRVLLTGHADKQSAIQAINQVALFQYLEKPWDNAQLLLVIQSGAERARLFRDLREKVEALDNANSSLKSVQTAPDRSVSVKRSHSFVCAQASAALSHFLRRRC